MALQDVARFFQTNPHESHNSGVSFCGGAPRPFASRTVSSGKQCETAVATRAAVGGRVTPSDRVTAASGGSSAATRLAASAAPSAAAAAPSATSANAGASAAVASSRNCAVQT
jgi:hypothetical protein